MSKTKNAIFDSMERQHQTWAQSPTDGMATKQIEADQQACGESALNELAAMSEKHELEF